MSWKAIPGDELIIAAETYKTVSRLVRTYGDSPDTTIISQLTSVPFSDIEQELESILSIGISVKAIRAIKVSDNVYDQEIEYTCDQYFENSPAIPIAVWYALSIAIPLIIAYLTIPDILEHTGDFIEDAFYIETPFGVANIFPIIVVGIIVIAIIMLFRR